MSNPLQSFYSWYKSSLRNSKYRWIIIGGTLLYLFSPIDIAPDFIPGLGLLDDGILVGLLVTEVSLMMSEYLSGRLRKPSDSVSNENTVIDVPVE